MIIDTDFVIDLTRNDVKAVRKLAELLSRAVPLAVASPTIFELYSGLIRSKKPEAEKRKVIDAIHGLIVYSLGPDSAKRAGEIDGLLALEGTPIDSEDTMIAGIAMANGEAVLTQNVRHFSRIKGLMLETY